MSEDRPVRRAAAAPSEQEIAGRDPSFPGLGVLVDPEFVCGLVRRHAAADPGPGRLVDLRYHPGVLCLATYAFGRDPHTTWVHARALRAGEPAPRDDRTEVGISADGLGFCRLDWEHYGLAVRAFPCDDRLPALPLVAEPARFAELLECVLPGRASAGLTARTVSYRPERRWLGAVEGPAGPVAALRIHSAGAFGGARWNAESLHDGAGLRLPRPLGRSREHCATASEWTPGRTLEAAVFDPGLHGIEIEGVGAALAELHAQDPGALPHCPPAGGAPRVRALAGRLGFILPRAAQRARRLADRLVRRLVELSPEDQPIHGSLKPDKIVLQGGGRVVMLDLDRACQGPLARDAGSLIGHLERAAVAGELTRERADWVREAFLDGYDRTATWPLRRRAVVLHASLTLFELALQPFRVLLPEWPARAMAILARAERVLGH